MIVFHYIFVRNYWLITNVFRNNLITVLTVLTQLKLFIQFQIEVCLLKQF